MNVACGLGGIVAPVAVGYAVGSSAGYAAAFGFLTVCAGLYLLGSLLIDFRRPLAV
jgi:ACS family D-galactonate transporter-like MFS transporter